MWRASFDLPTDDLHWRGCRMKWDHPLFRFHVSGLWLWASYLTFMRLKLHMINKNNLITLIEGWKSQSLRLTNTIMIVTVLVLNLILDIGTSLSDIYCYRQSKNIYLMPYKIMCNSELDSNDIFPQFCVYPVSNYIIIGIILLFTWMSIKYS